jgi:hypothetical protein
MKFLTEKNLETDFIHPLLDRVWFAVDIKV